MTLLIALLETEPHWKSYRPSNKVPFGGVILLILSTLIGLLAGKICCRIAVHRSWEHLSDYYRGCWNWNHQFGRQSRQGGNPMLASFFGLIFGILAYGAIHYFRYLAWPQADWYDIFEYLALKATEGMVIRIRGGRLVNLGPFSRGFIGFGTSHCIRITYGGRILCARQPFGEQRNQWYGKGKYLGSISVDQIEEFKRLVQIGDFVRVGEMLARIWLFPTFRISACLGKRSS